MIVESEVYESYCLYVSILFDIILGVVIFCEVIWFIYGFWNVLIFLGDVVFRIE